MILDKTVMIADDLAYDGTPTVIDLETVRPGPGRPVKMFIQGSSNMLTPTGFTVLDDADGDADETLIAHTCDIVGKLVEFELPSDVKRYVKVTLTGTMTQGTWNCGLILEGAQTNL